MKKITIPGNPYVFELKNVDAQIFDDFRDDLESFADKNFLTVEHTYQERKTDGGLGDYYSSNVILYAHGDYSNRSQTKITYRVVTFVNLLDEGMKESKYGKSSWFRLLRKLS